MRLLKKTIVKVPSSSNGIGFFLPIAILFISFFLSLGTQAQEEFIKVKSNKTIKIDKVKGTAILEGEVQVIQESTQSSLKSDQLVIQRDSITNKTILVKAKGNVRGLYNDINNTTGTMRTIEISCNSAEMDRVLDKAVIKGLVVIKSYDFEMTADMVLYDFKQEVGTITEIPGKQVLLKLTKNASSDKNQANESEFIPQIIEGAADEFRIIRSLRKITLQGKIKFFDHSEQARFSGQRADVYFDQFEKLNRIIAYQDVTISQPKRVSKADRAVFDYQTNAIILTGNASVQELNQMELNSPNITMHMDENKGIISGNNKAPVKAKVKISP